MELKDFNVVTECGSNKRAIVRYKDICYIGCFSGTKEETIEAINKKYEGEVRDRYIDKIEELFATNISSYKERGIDLAADYNQVLFWACKEGRLDVVEYLVSQGISTTIDDNGPIYWASKFGHLEVVKYLVTQGADVQANDNLIIRLAAKNNYLELIKYLVLQGADIGVKNNYPLWIAERKGYHKVVEYLLKQGAILE